MASQQIPSEPSRETEQCREGRDGGRYILSAAARSAGEQRSPAEWSAGYRLRRASVVVGKNSEPASAWHYLTTPHACGRRNVSWSINTLFMYIRLERYTDARQSEHGSSALSSIGTIACEHEQ